MEKIIGKVISVFVGAENAIASIPTEKLYLEWDGVKQDRHYGRTKFAGVREKYLPKGTEMLNLRQVSLVSVEENLAVAKKLGLAEILPEDLGANILLTGIKDFTKVPFGAIMLFQHGTCLLLTGDNYPCTGPGKEIAKRNNDSSLTGKFAKQALHLRGQTAMILKAGIIKPGDTFEIIIPKEVQTGLNSNLDCE